MNAMNYALSNESCLPINFVIADLTQLNSALIFPKAQEFETLKNYDFDPITPEEEIDLIKSEMDLINGRFTKFSATDSREEILKHLRSL
jgi:hypothetical protein